MKDFIKNRRENANKKHLNKNTKENVDRKILKEIYRRENINRKHLNKNRKEKTNKFSSLFACI